MKIIGLVLGTIQSLGLQQTISEGEYVMLDLML